ncbi:MAG TPA: hypothetical protein VMD92_04325 [Acidobacteriaceae bacterium]|nr:hypothetical protein [Acidobacteriaceae bacterium]
MAEKPGWPQQPVISIRISDALRSRLERLKELLSKKSGDNVTTSEVAKQLLESAREDRLEVAELLTNATVALAAARRKAEAGLSLSRAEWIVLAYYIQQGVESHIADPISPATMKGILEAFLAAYQVRRGKKSSRDAHYLSNLPRLNREGKRVLGADAEGIDVSTAVERLIRAMKSPDVDEVWPQFAARNLYEFLEEESFGIEALNQALKPHWPVLWRATARGHYLVRGHPVRDASRSAASDHPWGPAISSVFEGGFVLSFATGSERDLFVLVSLPQSRQAMYEIGPWPLITEFRSMLENWNTSTPNSFWQGRWFFGYTAMETTVPPVWVRCQGSVSFGFTAMEWASLQAAFRRAWEMAQLQRISGELVLEYGEI